jgi:hypothetical protein
MFWSRSHTCTAGPQTFASSPNWEEAAVRSGEQHLRPPIERCFQVRAVGQKPWSAINSAVAVPLAGLLVVTPLNRDEAYKPQGKCCSRASERAQ